jgi:type 4 prepilin-like proteins leader peptide-processing enzyme
MYINNIHILGYFFIGLFGMFLGQFMNWVNIRFAHHKKVFCKELFTQYIPNQKLNMFLMFSIMALYVAILYLFGLNLVTFKYLLLTPLLISVLTIDFKEHIIPDRLILILFEIGMLFSIIEGFDSLNIFVDKILGMVIGFGIFGIITLIGGLLAKKKAMGYGDVKLMAALGLIFGEIGILMIIVIAFLIAAFVSIVLLVVKKKKFTEYIAFGPYIAIASFIAMLSSTNGLLFILLKIFTLGTYSLG